MERATADTPFVSGDRLSRLPVFHPFATLYDPSQGSIGLRQVGSGQEHSLPFHAAFVAALSDTVCPLLREYTIFANTRRHAQGGLVDIGRHFLVRRVLQPVSRHHLCSVGILAVEMPTSGFLGPIPERVVDHVGPFRSFFSVFLSDRWFLIRRPRVPCTCAKALTIIPPPHQSDDNFFICFSYLKEDASNRGCFAHSWDLLRERLRVSVFGVHRP